MQAAINSLPSDIKADLDTANNNIIQYSYSHTPQETLGYAQSQLTLMTDRALNDSDIFEPSSGYWPTREYGGPTPFGYTDWWGINFNDQQREQCIRDQKEACRRDYNAEIMQSAGIGTGVFLGCGALTAGIGILGCAVGGLGIHALGIAAARQRREACELRAVWNCQ